MTIEIIEGDFIEETQYSTVTVSYLLEEMKARLPENVFLLNKQNEWNNIANTTPYIYIDRERKFQSSLGNHLNEVIKDPEILPDQFAIATVINVQGNHYISAVFRQEDDIKTLVIHDPLGEPGKTGGYDNYAKKIQEEFENKFGAGITIEINPKNSVLYQNDITSCGPVCIENLETLLNNTELQEKPQLGITKDGNGEFRCAQNARLLRQNQLKKLQHLQTEELVNQLMGGKSSISSEALVEQIFDNNEYSPDKKTALLNTLLDTGMIEGANNLSKDQIVRALHNNRNRTTYDVGMSDSISPGLTPTQGKKNERGRERR